MKTLCIIVALYLLVAPAVVFAESTGRHEQDVSVESGTERQGLANRFKLNFSNMSKEKKALTLNLALSAGLITYGAVFWDYSLSKSPHMQSEGWFGSDTKNGGADKVGHFYTSYALGDMFSYVYDKWGFSRRRAGILAFFSSFTFTALMEIGDSFSDYGLSYEDVIANITGAAASYILHANPELSEKIDLRVEYRPSGNSDIVTDYDHMKFLVAVKAEGFKSIDNNLLKYLELHFGYYARGFEEDESIRYRNIYMGVGLNLSRLFRTKSRILSKVFTYYQMPYTYLPVEKTFESYH
jgi:uncharacterized protein YfiM (DUF2279 family)